MNSQQAKSILKAYRPNGREMVTPQVAEALDQLKKDPQLARWFAEQNAFDASMVSALKALPVPPVLPSVILTNGNLRPWRRVPNWPARLALAASIVILASLAVLWLKRDANDLAVFRNEIAESAWSDSEHIGLVSGDLNHIQQWLQRENAPANFTLPSAVEDLKPQGCHVVDWRGEKASLICFLNGGRHLHLVVIDKNNWRDMPLERSPDFEKCSGWKTVCWIQGDKTYLLTGVNYLTFIKKSRKAGRWSVTG